MLFVLAQLALANDVSIEAHLYTVVDTLRAETPIALDPATRARRLEYLDLLEDYASAGDFPAHHGAPPVRPHPHTGRVYRAPEQGAMPLFVDADGTHCAVGYLMAAEHPKLVERVVSEANEAFIHEMRVEGLAEWADYAGFTVDELAWIQPSYGPAPFFYECADYEPDVYGQGNQAGCAQGASGVDVLAFHEGRGQACLSEDGSVTINAWVQSSREGAVDVQVWLGTDTSGAPDFAEQIEVDLMQFEVVPFVVDDPCDIENGWMVQVQTDGEDCRPENNVVTMLPPLTRDNADQFGLGTCAWQDPSNTGRATGGGCSTMPSAPMVAWLGVLGLGLLRRRRRL